MVRLDWKRGDTLEVQCIYQDANGTALSLDGITVTSQVRKANDLLLSDAAVTVTDEDAGEFTILFADTSDWPLGAVYWDIQYAFDGKIVSTETVELLVCRDVTR